MPAALVAADLHRRPMTPTSYMLLPLLLLLLLLLIEPMALVWRAWFYGLASRCRRRRPRSSGRYRPSPSPVCRLTSKDEMPPPSEPRRPTRSSAMFFFQSREPL